MDESLKQTALWRLHQDIGAKMVPFAGYDMPVHYATGIKQEHLHTREKAGLFDVSHMGQVILRGADRVSGLEALVPGELQYLKPNHLRYSFFTNAQGGILDDLMITNRGEDLFLVVNAACKAADIAHLRAHLPEGVSVEVISDRALLALQGPGAAVVLSRLLPGVEEMTFMSYRNIPYQGTSLFVSRSGYTGEDGYEISVPDAHAPAFAQTLLAQDDVAPVGLGARDSLRLEAGLCLYGHDLTPEITPATADLIWAISKRRRQSGGFAGAEVILRQIAQGTARKRVGLLPDGKAPAREGTEIRDMSDRPVGVITSGGFAPSLGRPVAMGYVDISAAQTGTGVHLMVRGTARPAKIVPLPFVPHRFVRRVQTETGAT